MSRLKIIGCAALMTALFGWMTSVSGHEKRQSLETIRAQLELSLTNPDVASLSIDRLTTRMNVSPEFKAVLVESMDALLHEPIYLDFIVNEAYLNQEHILGSDGRTDILKAQDLGAALGQARIAKGIPRLSVDEQRFIYGVTFNLLKNMPPEGCGRIVAQKIATGEMQQIELMALSKLPHDETRKYLRLNHKALVAELMNHPIPVPLSKSELNFAGEAIGDAIDDAILTHPRRHQLEDAIQNQRLASDQDMCILSGMAITAAINLKGTVGDWAIRALSQE